MKKLLHCPHGKRFFLRAGLVGIMLAMGLLSFAFAADPYDILNKEMDKVFVSDDITHPLSEGAYNPGTNIQGLYVNGQIFSFLQAENQTIAYIQSIVNRSLMIIGMIALLYLVYTGFIMLTAAGDEAKFKKGVQAAKATAIALIGIGVSAFLVNFILYVIAKLL